MKASAIIVTVGVCLSALSAGAQDNSKSDQSDLNKRVLEALKNIHKKDEPAPSEPTPPEAEKPKKSKPATDLPGFAESVPVDPPAQSQPEKKPEPVREKPRPEVIRVDAQPPSPTSKATEPVPAPRGTGAAAPSQPAAAQGTYTVQEGDTFSGIALRVYGDEQRWIAIAKANPLVDPVRLKVGQILKLPDLNQTDAERSAAFAEIRREVATPAGTTQTILVEPGDSLGKIAQRAYGRASLWRLIFEANADQLRDPDELRVGMKLKVPPIEGSKPESGEQRPAPSNTDGSRG